MGKRRNERKNSWSKTKSQ